MTTQIVKLCGDTQRAYAKTLIDAAPVNATATVRTAKEARTMAQNRLIHRWFGDISRHLMGESEADVKVRCNLMYGKPILARDNAEWGEEFSAVFEVLSYEKKLNAIKTFDIPFTRNMSVKQLSEYMNEMQRDHLTMGIRLTDPDARKYESEAE